LKIMVKSHGADRKAELSQQAASNFLSSWRSSKRKSFNNFCLRRAFVLFSTTSLFTPSCAASSVFRSTALCSSAPLSLESQLTHLPWPSTFFTHREKRVESCQHKTQTYTTICLWGGFFNALLANLIYISGRLIFLATEIGEISSAFVFSTLMHQYSMMSKDYDRHTDLDLAMILFVFLD
jgi:hypothetical protein